MVAVTKIIAISITLISLLVGVIAFFILSELPKEQKKQQVEELISQLINFIIFIWVSKVILNFSIFISDPLSILAYPSDSSAFYLAIFLQAILLFYKSKRGQLKLLLFVRSLIPVFLVGTFLYEFFQFTLNNHTVSIGSMVLQAILLVLYLYLQGKMKPNWLITVMLSGFVLGMFILSIFQPYVAIFGYLIEPWFLVVFFVVGLTINIVNQRKEG